MHSILKNNYKIDEHIIYEQYVHLFIFRVFVKLCLDNFILVSIILLKLEQVFVEFPIL